MLNNNLNELEKFTSTLKLFSIPTSDDLDITNPKYIKADLQYILNMVLRTKSTFLPLTPVFALYKRLEEHFFKGRFCNKG